MNSPSEHTFLSVETQYLPPISAFVRMQSFSHISIDGEENFRKSSWRNRCRIIGANRIILLSIPITGGRGVKSKTKDVRISNDEPWQHLHWKSMMSSYGKSSYFIFYEERFRKIYEKRFEFLIEFNSELLQVCFEILHWQNHIMPGEADEADVSTLQTVIRKLPTENFPKYHQVFEEKHGFIADASVVDLIFNLGNEAEAYLKSISADT